MNLNTAKTFLSYNVILTRSSFSDNVFLVFGYPPEHVLKIKV